MKLKKGMIPMEYADLEAQHIILRRNNNESIKKITVSVPDNTYDCYYMFGSISCACHKYQSAIGSFR